MSIVRLPPGPGSSALREVSRRLTQAPGPVVIVAADLVVADTALAPLTRDPFAGTALLVRPGRNVPAGSAARSYGVRVRHHVVVSVGSQFHHVGAPDHVSVGALSISANDTAPAADAILRLCDAVDSGTIASDGADSLELAALALVRSGVSVRAVDLVDVPWFRSPSDVAQATQLIASVSDQRIAQLQANRIDDGFYSTFVVRRLSKPLTRAALRLGWTPNAVTLLSFAIGLVAAASFAIGDRWALVVGAVLLQVSLIVDCVDGEVARATRRFSALGAWLDASTDRVKEFLAYAGLAAGAVRVGLDDIWWLAVVLVVLQTTRHMTDYDFSRIQRLREATVPPRDIGAADDNLADGAGWSVGAAMELSTRLNRRDAVRWFKKAIHLPIGERWLIISVVAAAAGAKWALAALLVAGLLALAYVSAGRVLRTLTWRGPTPDPGALLLSRQSDAGPIASLLGRLVPSALVERAWRHRAAWAAPALLRLVELGLVAVIVLAWHPTAVVVAFWWLAVVAFHLYDTLYRALQDSSPPRWLTWVGLGFDGRTILVVALAIVGATALAAGLAWGAGLLAAWFVVVASVQWLSVQRTSRSGAA